VTQVFSLLLALITTEFKMNVAFGYHLLFEIFLL